jgi:hypothetical protein
VRVLCFSSCKSLGAGVFSSAVTMTEVNFEDLSLSDDEGLSFDIEEEESSEHDTRLCLVGRFLVNRPVRLKEMKIWMSEVWRPVKGVAVKETQPGLFLFQFFRKLDMEEVLKGGPWTYDNHSLVLEKLRLGVPLKDIQLNYMNLWVRVYNLPTGMMKEKVRMGLANYIGDDGNNNSSFWREYMRLKVRFDIRKPLKIGKKIKANGGEWYVVKQMDNPSPVDNRHIRLLWRGCPRARYWWASRLVPRLS